MPSISKTPNIHTVLNRKNDQLNVQYNCLNSRMRYLSAALNKSHEHCNPNQISLLANLFANVGQKIGELQPITIEIEETLQHLSAENDERTASKQPSQEDIDSQLNKIDQVEKGIHWGKQKIAQIIGACGKSFPALDPSQQTQINLLYADMDKLESIIQGYHELEDSLDELTQLHQDFLNSLSNQAWSGPSYQKAIEKFRVQSNQTYNQGTQTLQTIDLPKLKANIEKISEEHYYTSHPLASQELKSNTTQCFLDEHKATIDTASNDLQQAKEDVKKAIQNMHTLGKESSQALEGIRQQLIADLVKEVPEASIPRKKQASPKRETVSTNNPHHDVKIAVENKNNKLRETISNQKQTLFGQIAWLMSDLKKLSQQALHPDYKEIVEAKSRLQQIENAMDILSDYSPEEQSKPLADIANILEPMFSEIERYNEKPIPKEPAPPLSIESGQATAAATSPTQSNSTEKEKPSNTQATQTEPPKVKSNQLTKSQNKAAQIAQTSLDRSLDSLIENFSSTESTVARCWNAIYNLRLAFLKGKSTEAGCNQLLDSASADLMAITHKLNAPSRSILLRYLADQDGHQPKIIGVRGTLGEVVASIRDSRTQAGFDASDSLDFLNEYKNLLQSIEETDLKQVKSKLDQAKTLSK